MHKFTIGQKKILAEFLANLSIAWIVASVISPFFSIQKDVIDTLPRMILGIILSIFFINLSLFLAKEVK